MRSATFAIAGSYALLANAQVGQNTASGPESLTPFQAAQANCLAQCHVADVGCRTDCINVHNPSGDPILAVQKCQAGCVQGDGSVEQTSSYGICLQDCVELGNVVSTVGGAAPDAATGLSTSSSATATATETGSASSASGLFTNVGTLTASGAGASATASTVAASATATGNAADAVRVGTAGLGLSGLLAAFIM